jgi:multidrug efflux pump subunit AcrA (membrane-fusion protein)
MSIDTRSTGVRVAAVIGAVLVLLIIFRVVQAMSPGEPQPTVDQIRAEQGVTVSTATVAAGELAVWREFNGTVSGAQEAVVRARTGDQVTSVPVTVGTRVRRGQVLVQQSGEGTAARVRQAEAARRQAASTVERLRPLHAAGAISEQEWEQAQTQLELATADVVAARDNPVPDEPPRRHGDGGDRAARHDPVIRRPAGARGGPVAAGCLPARLGCRGR